jgi:ABC-type antimicrobial peptide transport system permease subunit
MVGLCSVVAYLVAQRAKAFGIRLALGATRAHILWLVLRTNMVVILSGAVAGILLSLAVRRIAGGWLEGASQTPELNAATAAILVIVATAACLAPARRAAMTQPGPTGGMKSIRKTWSASKAAIRNQAT